jgi:hypothetical protein
LRLFTSGHVDVVEPVMQMLLHDPEINVTHIKIGS